MTEELQAPEVAVGELVQDEPAIGGELDAQPEADVGERNDSDGGGLDPNFDNLPADQLTPEEQRYRSYYKKAMEEQALRYKAEQEKLRQDLEARGADSHRTPARVDQEQLERDLQTLLAYDEARRGTAARDSVPVEGKLDPLADDFEQRLAERQKRLVEQALSEERKRYDQELAVLKQRELKRDWDAFCATHRDAENLKYRMADYLKAHHTLGFAEAYKLAKIDAATEAKRESAVLPNPLGPTRTTPPKTESVSGTAPSDKSVASDLSGLSPYQKLLKQAENDPDLAASLKVLEEERQRAILAR